MAHIIQMSVYNYNVGHEFIYETEIDSLEELLSLSYKFDTKIKYKKKTDKNWYYAKTMVRRLFKKELEIHKPIIKVVKINDLTQILWLMYLSKKAGS